MKKKMMTKKVGEATIPNLWCNKVGSESWKLGHEMATNSTACNFGPIDIDFRIFTHLERAVGYLCYRAGRPPKSVWNGANIANI